MQKTWSYKNYEIKEKIDAADFNNRALKFEKTGKKEIDLSEMTKHVTMD